MLHSSTFTSSSTATCILHLSIVPPFPPEPAKRQLATTTCSTRANSAVLIPPPPPPAYQLPDVPDIEDATPSPP